MRLKQNASPAASNDLLAIWIEALSLLVAEIIGVPALLAAHSPSEFVLVYTFGIACGGLGSRLSAMRRERVSEQRLRGTREHNECF